MSLLNGFSALGQGVSQFAGTAGLEAQKADLTRQSLMLADQLATTRESVGRQEAGQIAAGAQERAQTFTAGQSTLADQRLAARESAGRQEAASLAAAAPSPEIKSAQQFAKLGPEEKQAYREEMMTKAGLPAWMIGGDTPSSPTGTPSTFDTGSAVSPPPPAPSPTEVPGANRNDQALAKVPGAAASIVKGMVDGRIAPPSSFAMSKPYWQGLIAKAAEYDPTFDQTTWAGRVATRKSFAAGNDATAVTALNTALGHAGKLADQFTELNNSGGLATPLNAPVNAVEGMFGDNRQTNVQQTVDALASEARKVFASSGGGNLTELQEWQKNFPINGSPSQQQGALTNFVGLLDSRLQSLAEKYNRGMGRTDDPMNLLQPNARAVYKRLTGAEPEDAVGKQMGATATPSSTPSATAVAPTNPAAREIGKSYPLPNGKTGIWRGTGWEVSP